MYDGCALDEAPGDRAGPSGCCDVWLFHGCLRWVDGISGGLAGLGAHRVVLGLIPAVDVPRSYPTWRWST